MLSKKYSTDIESKWQQYWLEHKTYKFNRKNISKKELFVIDSPPPFTSGKLHMGHVLSYSYFDFAARFKRMNGFEVLYPQGWDAQGFPTEVKVERKYGRLPKEEFRKKCIEWSKEMIKNMKEGMIKLGFSPDWDLEYITMEPEYHKIVQESVIEMYEKGEIYRDKHPVLYCPRCRSAIAKAETKEKEEITSLYYFKFDDLIIASTRPELLHACVAVLVNNKDYRYKDKINTTIKTPFGKEVPIIGDDDVDMKFGSGAVMVCTYGDKMDVVWQKRYNLPVIEAFDEAGKVKNSPFYNGLNFKEARKKVVEFLKKNNLLLKEEKIKHTVKIHDRCNHEIELLPSMEWFANVKKHSKDIKDMAHKIKWFPDFGIHYLIDWLDHVDWNWVISRDRIFGTPIPFYVCEKCNYVEKADTLPFYPEKAKPKKCPKCGANMKAEEKVLDVWIDSSITPLIVSGWKRDKELFEKAYPTTLRPQGVEIIRTWAFYTIYRSGVVLTGKPPWKEILLNGNVLSTDGKKMSKSLNNTIDPMALLSQYPADAIRQWAAMSGAMAKDRPFSYEDIKFAKQFLNKFWNAFRLAESVLDTEIEEIEFETLRTVDKWILSELSITRDIITKAFNEYDYRKVITTFHTFFWNKLCDYYLEYVKYRLYKNDKKAIYTLKRILLTSLKLFAPIAPHITEEIYHTVFKKDESIHLSKWPKEIKRDEISMEIAIYANEFMRLIREYKAKNRLSMNAELKFVQIKSPKNLGDFIEDIKYTGKIKQIEWVEDKNISIYIE